MQIRFIQKFIDLIRGKNSVSSIKHKVYGKIYVPYYNTKDEIRGSGHKIYNEDGQEMETYFIRDRHFAHDPYCESKYFIWDRYNIALKTHFYTHNSMLETMGFPDYKYGILIESPSIAPEDYQIFKKNKGLDKDFDLIFTYSYDILEKIDNARFVPFCAKVWNQDDIVKDSYLNKTKNISILSSDKLMCDLHKFRYNLAWDCKQNGLADTYGTFDNGNHVKLVDTLNEYRYTICIENDISPYFFTERFTTALACGVVPIYMGATEIDKFFNPDGIIKFTKNDNIFDVLKQCTKEEYEKRLPAVMDNIKRAEKYFNPFDFMYEEYLRKR